MPYNATKIRIKFDKKKTFNRKSIKYLQKFIFQESVKLPFICSIAAASSSTLMESLSFLSTHDMNAILIIINVLKNGKICLMSVVFGYKGMIKFANFASLQSMHL